MKEVVERLHDEDVFDVWVPNVVEVLDVQKAGGDDPELTHPIQGWASTEDLDRQGEIVVAKGLDFTEFTNWGWYNNNHKQDPWDVLGYPRLARLEKGTRWWTEGNLIPGYPPADKLWDLGKSLKKGNAPRRLGMSIEGKVVQRDGRNKILRANVRHVALTASPVNTSSTWEVVCKAFSDPDSVSQACVASTEIRRETELTFNKAVAYVQRLHPHVSRETCRRVVAFAFMRDDE